MNYILYGEDEFSRDEALASLTENIDIPDLKNVNTTILDGGSLTFEEFVHTCNSIPFLAENRIVIVKGLFSIFERKLPSRTRRKPNQPATAQLGDWKSLSEYIRQAPESTTIVFVDGRLNPSNILLSAVREEVKILHYPALDPTALRQWIRDRIESLGANIESRAVDSLASIVGPDLRTMSNELVKLSIYADPEPIREGDVDTMVSYAKEANIFSAIDAMFEGRTNLALRLTHELLRSGSPPAYLLSMIARQVRLLIIAKDLRVNHVSEREYPSRLALSGYPLRKTLEQADRFSPHRLSEIHQALLETDLGTKTKTVNDETLLDIFIARISSGTDITTVNEQTKQNFESRISTEG